MLSADDLTLKSSPMYICLCNAITDRQIDEAAKLGARSPQDLSQSLGIGLGCGRCVSCAEEVLCEALKRLAQSTDKLAA